MPSLALKIGKFQLKGWQLLLLAFLVICGALFSIGLTSMSVVWDETPHLQGGLLIFQGKLGEYLAFSRYPPLMDFAVAGCFQIFGAGVFSARLASVAFSLLTIVAVFAFASKAYGRRVAFVSCAMLATMPGFIWLSRVTLLETALLFFFVCVLLMFLYWLHSGKNSAILLCGLMLGLAISVKFPGVIAGLVILAALPLLLYRSELKPKISKFPLILITAAAIVIPTLIWSYTTGSLFRWLSLLQSSDQQVNVYGARYPLPIFYLYEMTTPTSYGHPIFIAVFLVGMLGLGFLLWRRKPQDRLLLVWFAVVYVCFTLIGTKSWRYVLPLFPVIATSAASLLMFLYGKLENVWISTHNRPFKKPTAKILAVALVVFTAGSLVASCADAYNWLSTDDIYVPLPEAIHYIAANFDSSNQSVMIVCSVNMVNTKLADFYLAANEAKSNRVLVYPSVPSDAYTLQMNTTEMLGICRANDVKFLLVYENRGYRYFNSTMTATSVVELLVDSGEIGHQASFGVQPNRLFVFQLGGNTQIPVPIR